MSDRTFSPGTVQPYPNDVVHLWTIALDAAWPARDVVMQLLDDAERARASRFRFDEDRRRYVRSHAALRSILARYPGSAVSSGELRFEQGEHGKPGLIRSVGAPPLHFNLAHSLEVACVAVTGAGRVGVDVERLHSIPEALEMAERYFSASERAVLARAPTAERDRVFLQCWTRKEAFIKAIGEGLSHPLDRFDVAVGPDDEARLIRIGGSREEAERWSMHALAPRAGYVAAVAVEAPGISLLPLDFDP